MKKKLIAYLAVLSLLVIGTIAADLVIRDREITTFTKEDRDILVTLDLTLYNTTDYQKGNEFYRCLHKPGVINTCIHTDNQSQLDKLEEAKLNQIIEATKKRQNKPETVELSRGQTTIIS